MNRMTVTERANFVSTFRYIHVRLMEMVARWTPITAEMEVKVMFGRHIWDLAQQADALGRRTFELRQPEQHSRAPVAEYVALINDVESAEGTAERLAGLYDALLPGLANRYRSYVSVADPILDEPTIVIVDRILRDFERLRRDADAVRRQMSIASSPPDSIVRTEQAIPAIVS